MGTATSLDLIVIGVYLLVVTAVGCWMSGHTRTAAEFMSAGGRLPGWVVGLSVIGTFVSSISFIANPGKTYAGNWNAFVFSLTLPYAAWVATKYFVPFFRTCGSLSAYEHLEHRFGLWARLYAAAFNVMYHVSRIGTILYGVSLAVSALIDVDLYVIIAALGILVIVYTLLGGIEAVIWTDVLQSIILVGGMLVCAWVLIAETPGGIFGILETASRGPGNKLSLGSLAFDFSGSTFWTVAAFGFVINLQNFAADQTYVQRYFTARSEADAARSVWIGALAYVPISAILFFTGTALFVFYQNSQTLPEGIKPDAVLPHFIINELPSGLSGLLIAAILAAAMSTVDSSLNSSVTLLLCDIRPWFLSGKATTSAAGAAARDRSDLRFLRWMTVILGCAGIGVACAMTRVQGLLDAWWMISGILSGGTLGLILLARFTNATGAFGAAAGVICGVTCIGLITLAHLTDLPELFQPLATSLHPVKKLLHPTMAIVVGTIAVLCVGAALSQRRTGSRHEGGS
ncbi:MAG: sodium:solute symporter [Planctomycetaceae bacterium]